jgi:hypothetical protein
MRVAPPSLKREATGQPPKAGRGKPARRSGVARMARAAAPVIAVSENGAASGNGHAPAPARARRSGRRRRATAKSR